MDIGIVAAAVSTFAASNLDDLVGLTAFFAIDRAAGGRNASRIWAGQLIGMGLLTAAGAVAAAALTSAPTSWVRFLALVPIGVGLSSLLRAPKDDGAGRRRVDSGSVFAVVGFTLGNGGDNIALYVPLFRGLTTADDAAVAICFGAMAVLWCSIAHLAGRGRPEGAERRTARTRRASHTARVPRRRARLSAS